MPCQVYAIARFSRWLERMNVPLEDLDESGVRDFLAAIRVSCIISNAQPSGGSS